MERRNLRGKNGRKKDTGKEEKLSPQWSTHNFHISQSSVRRGKKTCQQVNDAGISQALWEAFVV